MPFKSPRMGTFPFSTAGVEVHGEGLLEHSALRRIEENRELDRISFSRSREVEINWASLIGETVADGTPYVKGLGTEYLRAELEARWGIPNGPSSDAKVLEIATAFAGPIDPPVVMFSAPGLPRAFFVVMEANEEGIPPLDPPVFSTIGEYNEFWKFVRFVHTGANERSEQYSLDLAPSIIYRQYRELRALQILGDSLATNAEKIASREFQDFPSAEELENLVTGYVRMRSVQTDVKIKLERLRDRARDLGYYLALEKETITLPDGTNDTIEPGQIYQPYLTEIRWQTLHYRRRLVRASGFLFSASWTIQVPYYLQHARVVTRYQKVIPDFDPWLEAERELMDQGFSVYRFERAGSRYITVQGDAIEDIAERCELDVEFSKKCAILVPVYEQSLVSGEILSKYIVIKRPRKGIQPLHLPRIFVEEDLLFATHFRHVEVGELVETINLAPGEEREIVIERTTLSEREERRTATSISDLTETDRVDLSSEMEKEFGNSNEKTSTSSLSAKAGGSVGAFSGSASGSTSSTQTTKQFARELQKVANRASRSVTKQTREEVKTETSIKTSVSTRNSTKIQIRNINDGRSLNLLFFQLYNIYEMSLQLERMSFTYLSGREVIAGTGIVVPEVYSLAELPAMLERASLNSFPVTPQPDASTAKESYTKALVAAVKKTLKEYKAGEADSSNTVEIGNWDVPQGDPAARHVDALAQALNQLRYTKKRVVAPGENPDKVVNPLVVGSPGLFLDAFVGVRPGTEPYSEDMRKVEFAKRAAEVREITSRAVYHESMARRLGRSEPGNHVVGRAVTLKELELTFAGEPLQGDWSLFIFEAFAQDFNISSTDLIQSVTFATDQLWLRQDSVEVARIVHKETGQELIFLI